MKFLVTLFCFFSLSVAAQNYDCLQSGTKRFFINGNNYLRGIKIDSTKIHGDSVIYYPFRSLRGPVSMTGYPAFFSFSLPLLDSAGGCWLGKKVVITSDGRWVFDSYWNDSVMIWSSAGLGDSWIFYSDSSGLKYKATVTNIDYEIVQSSFDSVKTIVLLSYTGAIPDTSDPLNSLTIKLSKNYGFIQAIDLYMFPYHPVDSAYRPGRDFYLDRSTLTYDSVQYLDGHQPTAGNVVFNLTDFHAPCDTNITRWQVGDAFEYYQTISGSTDGTMYLYDSVESISTTAGKKTYTLYEATQSPYGFTPLTVGPGFSAGIISHDIFDSSYSIMDTSYLPEKGFLPEWTSTTNTVKNIIYYIPHDIAFCDTASGYYQIPINWGGAAGQPGTGFQHIKTGLNIISDTLANSDGISFWFNETKTLIYSNYAGKKCGTYFPLAVPVLNLTGNELAFYPNPATSELILNASQHLGEIVIMDRTGRRLISLQTGKNEQTINIENFTSGCYILRLADGTTRKFTKI